jgi:hypothetical protein
MHAVLVEGSREDLARVPSTVRASVAPDSSLLLVPTTLADLAAHYDLTLSHPLAERAPFAAFESWLAEAAAARGLSCALLADGVVEEAVRRLDAGTLTIGYHLDYFALWHVADDAYARLAQAVQDAGGRPVNPPARSRTFTDKAVAHAELARRGLGVPETVLRRPWAPDRPLTAAEAARLGLDEPGAAVFVKPANGFGGRGVVRTEAAQVSEVLTALREQYPHDTLLVQRAVACPRLHCDDGSDRPAYWRVLYCLGDLLPLWWCGQDCEPGRPSYRCVTVAEMKRHRLRPLLDYTLELAELSGLNWFSTELTLSTGPATSRHTVWAGDGIERPVVAVDYLNDQCDVDVQSRWPGAPPDNVVRYVAERFADAAAVGQGQRVRSEGSLSLVAA